jgi:hypothetical protein
VKSWKWFSQWPKVAQTLAIFALPAIGLVDVGSHTAALQAALLLPFCAWGAADIAINPRNRLWRHRNRALRAAAATLCLALAVLPLAL